MQILILDASFPGPISQPTLICQKSFCMENKADTQGLWKMSLLFTLGEYETDI